MEWTVVGVLVVLIGLFLTVGKPILNLVTQLQGLRFDTDKQEKEIDRNIESIKELVRLSQSHEQRLTNNENRLLENEIDMREVRAQTSELLKITQSHEARITNLEIKSKEGEEK